MRTGELETQLAFDAVLERIEADEWTLTARRTVERLARLNGDFTADEVRQIAGNPPFPNAFGALFHALAEEGLIVAVGYRKSTRPEAHGRPIAVWRGA